MLSVDISKAMGFLDEGAVEGLQVRLKKAHEMLQNGTGEGSDFIGWVNLPRDFDRDEFSRIKKAAAKIRGDSQALIVIGIGGSYLGARAAVELLKSPSYNLLKKDTPDIFFAGNNLSQAHISEIIGAIEGRDFSVNVISKSGTTTEPAIAFRIFKQLLEQKYGKDGARQRIYATTDKARGALYSLACSEGYERFVIPDDVGGRFSVLTPVGLLPMAAAGIDIDAVMYGALEAHGRFSSTSPENPVWQYAAARNALYAKGYMIEVLAAYEPSFRFMAEWWKQLYGESEGKDHKGIFPASVEFTADLHSMGQYIQEGERRLFETVVEIPGSGAPIVIGSDEGDIDGLNFLAGKDLGFVNAQAMKGTLLAHVDGGVPNILIKLEGGMSERAFGELVYFFELSCGVSGYVLGVNPFNQPGVEAYKKNMFALLGKPGFEAECEALLKRL